MNRPAVAAAYSIASPFWDETLSFIRCGGRRPADLSSAAYFGWCYIIMKTKPVGTLVQMRFCLVVGYI